MSIFNSKNFLGIIPAVITGLHKGRGEEKGEEGKGWEARSEKGRGEERRGRDLHHGSWGMDALGFADVIRWSEMIANKVIKGIHLYRSFLAVNAVAVVD